MSAQDTEVTMNLAAADRVIGLDAPTLGMHPTEMAAWAASNPTLDLMKMGKPWAASQNWSSDGVQTIGWGALAETGSFDENGWPTEIPENMDFLHRVWSWSSKSDAAESRAGTYVLTYEGEGDVRVTKGVTIVSQEDGRIVFDNPEGTTFHVEIHETDPNGTGDHVRDMQVVRAEYEDLLEAGALFNPEYVDLLKDSAVIRFMKWSDVHEPEITTWEERPKLDDSDWMANGVPVEAMVQLANEIGADPWFTMPHTADQSYMEGFATYVRDHLDPNLKAHVEYSNEVWNWNYEVTHEMQSKAGSEWGRDDHKAMLNYYVKEATAMAQTFKAVFGDEAEDRLVTVLGGQTVNPVMTRNMLEADVWAENEPDAFVPPTESFDAIAVSTYFGNSVVGNDDYRADLMAAINDPDIDASAWLAERLMDPEYGSSIPQIADYLAEQKGYAAEAGLDLLTYEGGQHVHHWINGYKSAEIGDPVLQEFLTEFTSSPEMAMLYEEIWAVWAEVGDGPFMQFGDVAESSKYGSWSMYTTLDDENAVADTLNALNASTERFWDEDRDPTAFTHGVHDYGTDGDDVLIGTSEMDYLIGGDGDDVLVGGDGDDRLHGGAGHDIVQLAGSVTDYALAAEGDGFRLVSQTGDRFLIDIEQAEFTVDGLIDIVPGAPWLDVSTLDWTDVDVPPEAAPAATPVQIGNDGEIFDASEGVELLDLQSSDGGAVISSIFEWTLLGETLGLDGQTAFGYSIREDGATATINGVTHVGSNQTIQRNLATGTNELLDNDVIDTALAFGDIALGPVGIVGTDFDDVFHGWSADDLFYGGAGDDIVNSHDGDDTISGGAGDDRLNGGDGWDVVVFEGSREDYLVRAQNGSHIVTARDGVDILTAVEELRFDDGSMTLDSDTFFHGTQAFGSEFSQGTGGDDVGVLGVRGTGFDGWNGSDLVTVEGASTGITVYGVNFGGALGKALDEKGVSSNIYALHETGATAEIDGQIVTANINSMVYNKDNQTQSEVADSALDAAMALGSVARDVDGVIGTDHRDVFYGTHGDDVFHGGGDIDKMYGGNGDDHLYGGAGGDRLFGGDGWDTVYLEDTIFDYAFEFSSGRLEVAGHDSTDRLFDIEEIKFSDGISVLVEDLI